MDEISTFIKGLESKSSPSPFPPLCHPRTRTALIDVATKSLLEADSSSLPKQASALILHLQKWEK